MNDITNHKLKWGKYKGTCLKDIPDDYLQWILNNKPDVFKGKMLVYIKTRLKYPKDKYEVTVTDSVGTDGVYIVESYNNQQAINVCKRQYNIQCTQSYHGTEFSVKKFNMKNRTIKELFEVMLENQNHFVRGMCTWIVTLRGLKLINSEEQRMLLDYIIIYKPYKFYSWEVFMQYRKGSGFYWKCDNLKPRVKWIKKQIKKLS